MTWNTFCNIGGCYLFSLFITLFYYSVHPMERGVTGRIITTLKGLLFSLILPVGVTLLLLAVTVLLLMM